MTPEPFSDTHKLFFDNMVVCRKCIEFVKSKGDHVYQLYIDLIFTADKGIKIYFEDPLHGYETLIRYLETLGFVVSSEVSLDIIKVQLIGMDCEEPDLGNAKFYCCRGQHE